MLKISALRWTLIEKVNTKVQMHFFVKLLQISPKYTFLMYTWIGPYGIFFWLVETMKYIVIIIIKLSWEYRLQNG